MKAPRRFTRPYKLEGDRIGYLHVRIPADLKERFSDHCRDRHIGASEVVRELIEMVLSGKYKPPVLRKQSPHGG